MPQELRLYPIQESALAEVRSAMRAGNKRVMLYGPTGFGKTEVSLVPMKGAADKGKHATFLCDRIPLVSQTSKRLSGYGIQHGVAQGKNTERLYLPLQVMSMQTMERRGYWDPELDLLVYDEAHTNRRKILDAAKEWGGYVLGLSASPITKGLGRFWDCVVNGATTVQLLKTINEDTGRPYLCPLTFYAAREINMQGAQITSTGEWLVSHVEMRTSQIIGSIVPEWKRRTDQHFQGPVPTLAFSRSVKQGEQIRDAFLEAGIDARQSTYMDNRDDTDEIVEDFANGKFPVLISVDKFVKGYDNKQVQCILDCNPRRTSLAPLIQGMGRGMRDMAGKSTCLYIDYCGNISGWYEEIQDIWVNGISELDDRFVGLVRREGRERKEITCPACGFMTGSLSKTGGICPSCGWQRPQKPLESVPGYTERVEGLDDEQAAPKGDKGWRHDPDWTWRQMSTYFLMTKKGDQEAAATRARAMYMNFFGEWPRWGRELEITDEPISDELKKRVRYHDIRYQNSKKKKGWK